MKRLIVASLLFASPALAQTSPPVAKAPAPGIRPTTVEQACVFIAKSVLMLPDLKVGIVQAFPELDPPGARVTFSDRMDAQPVDITDEIECQFENSGEPLKIARFCIESTCYAADSDEPKNRRRFQEVVALMQRLR